MARLTMRCRILSAASMAGQLAGFNVLQIINEATAAALAYGLDKLAIGNQSGFTKVEVGNLASIARGHNTLLKRSQLFLQRPRVSDRLRMRVKRPSHVLSAVLLLA